MKLGFLGSLWRIVWYNVVVCDSRGLRRKRQVVEDVISQIKLFNAGSGWRTLTCVFVYAYAYAIGYSFYRRFV
ncbi:MAG: hypothetical protein ACK4F9_03725 [Brevinematia bacterium]